MFRHGRYDTATNLELDPATGLEGAKCLTGQAHWVINVASSSRVNEVERAREDPIGLKVISFERAIGRYPDS